MAGKLELDGCVVLENVEIIKLKGKAVNVRLDGDDSRKGSWIPLSQLYHETEELENAAGGDRVSLLIAKWICDNNEWEYSEEIPAKSLVG